ncbi:cytochrome P450 [Schizopora paradoxa]|uniref:Cytochrome P450 n=1 Tax=Schizopora paradoxa TaxID=27342 RepID=A0A0H2RVP7_9AGAM|nr:cytochrome P450 [Schizopora paradoxa]
MQLISVSLFCACIITWCTVKRILKKKKANPDSLPYPPGPPAKWIIGNLLDMPASINFKALRSWKEKYGDLTFMRACGQSVLVINSLKAAKDLLDKRGTTYAHRPSLVMAGELMGLDQSIGLMAYCPRLTESRRLAHRALSNDAIKRYTHVFETNSILLLQKLLDDPSAYEKAIRLMIGRNILMISYGLTANSADSEFIADAEKVMKLIQEAIAPGKYLVDYIPCLKRLPSWMPFVNFKREAESYRKQITDFVRRPFEHVKADMHSPTSKRQQRGIAAPSLVLDLLSQDDKASKECNDDREEIIMWAIGSLYGAATSTTAATALTFVVLMAMHPDKQRKAQAEIDSVTEGLRLPTLADRARMPYVMAIMNEVARWHAVVPLGLARQTKVTDNYNGYYIPEDTIVLYNLWMIGRTEGTSASLESFIPERHLDGSEALDPFSYVFGFGRRICPGRHLADNALFMIYTSILSSFTISKKPSPSAQNACEAGIENPLIPEFSKHLISFPEHFPCDFISRSDAAAALIKNAFSCNATA